MPHSHLFFGFFLARCADKPWHCPCHFLTDSSSVWSLQLSSCPSSAFLQDYFTQHSRCLYNASVTTSQNRSIIVVLSSHVMSFGLQLFDTSQRHKGVQPVWMPQRIICVHLLLSSPPSFLTPTNFTSMNLFGCSVLYYFSHWIKTLEIIVLGEKSL